MQVPGLSYAANSFFFYLGPVSPPSPLSYLVFKFALSRPHFPPIFFFLWAVGDRAVAENIGQFSRKEEEADRVGRRPSQSFTSTREKTAHLTGHSF